MLADAEQWFITAHRAEGPWVPDEDLDHLTYKGVALKPTEQAPKYVLLTFDVVAVSSATEGVHLPFQLQRQA